MTKKCKLINNHTKAIDVHCPYRTSELDFNALETLNTCIQCLVKKRRYFNDVIFLVLKDLRARRRRLKKGKKQ